VPFPPFLADTLAAVMGGKGRGEPVFTAPAGGALRVSTWRPRVFGPVLKRLMVGEFPVVTSARSPAHRGVARDQRRRQREGRADDARSRVRSARVGQLFPDDLEMVSAALYQARLRSLEAAADRHRKGPDQECLIRTSHLRRRESGWRDSNPRPLRPERSTLPSCATPRVKPRQRIAPAHPEAKRLFTIVTQVTAVASASRTSRCSLGKQTACHRR
jgi:hypothetical protein